MREVSRRSREAIITSVDFKVQGPFSDTRETQSQKESQFTFYIMTTINFLITIKNILDNPLV